LPLRFSSRERRMLRDSPMLRDPEDSDPREPVPSEKLSLLRRSMMLPSTLSEEKSRRETRLSSKPPRSRD